MQVQRIDQMFNFTYMKSSAEIVESAKRKVLSIKRKIEERELRIKNMRQEHKITDAVLIDIMAQARDHMNKKAEAAYYSSTVRSQDGLTEETVTVGAGTINSLLTERDHIEGEKSHIDKLEMIVRNLRDVRKYAPDGKEYAQGHELNGVELKFLGF